MIFYQLCGKIYLPVFIRRRLVIAPHYLLSVVWSWTCKSPCRESNLQFIRSTFRTKLFSCRFCLHATQRIVYSTNCGRRRRIRRTAI